MTHGAQPDGEARLVEIPDGIEDMSDEEQDAWAQEIYRRFLESDPGDETPTS